MEYIEQLNQPEWLAKRLQVLKRDSNKCQNCFNTSYQLILESGILFSFTNDKLNIKRENTNNCIEYLVRIWDLKNNRLANSFLNNIEINENENYIAFYDNQNTNYSNIFALKKIEESRVEKMPILNIVKTKQLKNIVSDKTYKYVYEKVALNDEWVFIKGLHIHHKCYQKGKFAWEYDLENLQTLCWTCHENLHKNETVPILDAFGNEEGFYTYCKRCHGAGYFPEYKHVESGICFRCKGKRFEELI